MRVHGAWLEMRSTSAKSGGRATLGELATLQREQGVLVGHGGDAEARAAVAEVAAVVNPVVVVEGRALWPRSAVPRHGADRPPSGALERPGEGEAVVVDELVVTSLAVDPDPRLHGGMRKPAEATEGGRGEEGAARGEAGGLQLCGAPLERAVDAGREGRVLDRDPSVALDEHEQDVLAPQACQQPVAGSGAEAVVGDLAGEHRSIRQAGPHGLHLVDGQGGRARGGDRRADDSEGHPDHAQRDRRPERPVAVAGRDARHAQQRQDRDGEEPDEEHGRDRDGEVRARPADGVAQRLDADPRVARVVDGVERPVERREEPDVEHLHDNEHAEDRAQDHGQHAARGGGQQGGQGDDDE